MTAGFDSFVDRYFYGFVVGFPNVILGSTWMIKDHLLLDGNLLVYVSDDGFVRANVLRG